MTMRLGVFLLVVAAAATAAPKPESKPRVRLETSKGAIVLELDAVAAPVTVANFLDYVRAGHYDGTIFHRVIPGFMIQGGGFTRTMEQKATRPPIKNESANNLSNVRGTLAMARTAEPDSASCQFFINLKDNTFLDRAKAQDGVGYCVFGKVVSGMNVVDAIAAVPTGSQGMYQNVPREPVVITKATILAAK